MASSATNIEAAAAEVVEEKGYHYYAPLSPFSSAIHTSKLSIGILCLFETEHPIHVSLLPHLGRLFLSLNPRFSCVPVKDETTGAQHWKKVAVAVEDHLKVVPPFEGDEHLTSSTSTSTTTSTTTTSSGSNNNNNNDRYLQEYMEEVVAMEPFQEGRPLWELHLFNYPTSHAASSVILKLQHALGDGYSLMSAMLSCAKRADDPSRPLTFPASSSKPCLGKEQQATTQSTRLWRIWDTAVKVWRTTSDLGWRLLNVTRREDDRSAIRSGNPGIVSVPVISPRIVLSLDRIRQVKNRIGSTVNDVVTGMIFYGLHLYNRKMGRDLEGRRMTLLMALNTRIMKEFQSVKEMVEAKTWGNESTLVQVPIPSCADVENADPLSFVLEAKKIINKKKKSLLPIMMTRLLKLLWNLKGPEAVSLYYKEFVNNSSLVMSNMIGPKEKIKLADQELKNVCFFLTGLPNSLVASVISYNGQMTVAMTIEKGFIDPKLFVACMHEAFERISDSANIGMHCLHQSTGKLTL